MTASQGIHKRRQKAVDALFSKFCQLDDKAVFDPIDASTLMKDQKKAALRVINLIKEKCDGGLKGRTCTDQSIQHTLYTKDKMSFPMVATDALMLSLLIDAFKMQDVATADVVGAYLNTEMLDFVLL